MKRIFLYFLFLSPLISFGQFTPWRVNQYQGVASGQNSYSVTIVADNMNMNPFRMQQIAITYTLTNTGASTLKVNNMSAYGITLDGSALSAGDIVANQPVIMIFDVIGLKWCLIKGVGGGSGTVAATSPLTATSGTVSLTGIIPLANGGTNNTVGASALSAITDDNSTNSLGYQLWSSSNSGNQPMKTSSSFSRFNPSTSQYTFGTNLTSGSFCNYLGASCVNIDLVGYFKKDQNDNSRWLFENENTGTSALATLIINSNKSLGEYGHIEVVPRTNTSLGTKESIFRIASESGCLNGMELYSNNGVIAAGTVNHTTSGAAGFSLNTYSATCTECFGLNTRDATASLDIQRPGTTAYAPLKVASSGTNFLSSGTTGTLQFGTVGWVLSDALLIGGTTKVGVETFGLQGNTNSNFNSLYRNSSSGTAAITGHTMFNDDGKYITFQMFSSGYSSLMSAIPNAGRLYCSGTGGLSIVAGGATGGQIMFRVTSSEVNCWNMNTSGHFIPGAANTYDFASSGTPGRSGYFGTSLVAPAGTFSTSISMGTATFTNGVATGIELHTISTPTTASTATLVKNKFNAINPAGTIAALTITFPDSPNDNDFVEVKIEQIITTITYVAGTGGATILGQTNGSVGGYAKWVYDSGTNSWY